ncbi:MAG: DUF4340 domain-containing protein [Ruminococcus sp.]|nr:DUF4340 domain-containing protein [Ruminococcus sp.]
MKRPIVAFMALVIAAGASVGAYMAVKDKKKTEDKKAEEQAQSLVLFNFDPDSINKLEITAEGEHYTVEKPDEKWVITDGEDFPLEQDYITLICNYASTLTATTEYEGNKADYGLDSPETVTLYSNDASYTLNVGILSPTADYFYANTGDRDSIFAIPSISGSNLGLSRKFMRSKSITRFSDKDIVKYIFKKGGETTLTLEKDSNGSWLAPLGYEKFNFDFSNMSSMTNTITRIIIQDIVEHHPSDLSKYGLDKPKGEVFITGEDGTEEHILISEPYGDKVHSYVYLYDDDQVVSCYTGDIDFIDYTAADFASSNFTAQRYDDITGFELSFDGRDDSFTIDNENQKGTCNGTEFELTGDTDTSFQIFYSSFTNLSIVSLDNGKGPELKDPIMTAALHGTPDGDITYQLMKKDDKSAYLFINGEYSGYIVSTDSLYGKNSLGYFFERFRDTIGVE